MAGEALPDRAGTAWQFAFRGSAPARTRRKAPATSRGRAGARAPIRSTGTYPREGRRVSGTSARSAWPRSRGVEAPAGRCCGDDRHRRLGLRPYMTISRLGLLRLRRHSRSMDRALDVEDQQRQLERDRQPDRPPASAPSPGRPTCRPPSAPPKDAPSAAPTAAISSSAWKVARRKLLRAAPAPRGSPRPGVDPDPPRGRAAGR